VQSTHSATKSGYLAAVSLIAAVVMLLLAVAPQAQAAVSPYCGGRIFHSYMEKCNGAPRTLNAVYGWGNQAGVCAGAWNYMACAGPGSGAYQTMGGIYIYTTPWIMNAGSGFNQVSAVAYVP
jgi:hypothetical protein